jgi:hypothetical protein
MAITHRYARVTWCPCLGARGTTEWFGIKLLCRQKGREVLSKLYVAGPGCETILLQLACGVKMKEIAYLLQVRPCLSVTVRRCWQLALRRSCEDASMQSSAAGAIGIPLGFARGRLFDCICRALCARQIPLRMTRPERAG